MSEKKKLTQYELMMLASAYNLKYYCKKFKHCDDCIFNRTVYSCALADGDNVTRTVPYMWDLEEGDKNEKTDTNG